MGSMSRLSEIEARLNWFDRCDEIDRLTEAEQDIATLLTLVREARELGIALLNADEGNEATPNFYRAKAALRIWLGDMNDDVMQRARAASALGEYVGPPPQPPETKP